MGGTSLDRVVPGDGVALPHAALLLLAAVVAQGGYYLPGRLLTGVLVAAALLSALRRPVGFGFLPVACAGLATWAVLRAALDGTVAKSLPAVAAVGCLAAAAFVAARADVRQRELCASVLVGVGVLVALTGWVAVVCFDIPVHANQHAFRAGRAFASAQISTGSGQVRDDREIEIVNP